MANRRLSTHQPDSFSFNQENLSWAQKLLDNYPKGRESSAVIPLMWRAQEQHGGWLPKPAIEYIAEFLNMPVIRVLEVATFYTMFQLSPVGKKAHVQVCGTTPCMLRGSDEILRICKKRISETPNTVSEDGNFSWEEVECLGACVNAPMIQIFSDTYEDLTEESFNELLDNLENGKPIKPGPQTDRIFSMPVGGATSLTDPMLYDGSVITSFKNSKDNGESLSNAEAASSSAPENIKNGGA